MKSYAFGVDLGGTTVKLGLFHTDGTLIEKWEIITRTENHSEHLLPDIAQTIQDKMTEKAISADNVAGIGMGVPGAVLHDSFVKPCVNLDQWGGEIAQQLSDLCGGLPVKVVNDANAAALGEMSHGGGKGCNNMVLITLGTGVGGAVIVDGKLITGVHGAGGEIGHIKVAEPDDDICGCGKSGCLERYSSATGVVLRAKKLLEDETLASSMREFEPLTCKDVIDCAKAGDSAAMQIVELMTRMLGKALAIVSCVADPEVVVIGGGVSRAGSIITDGIHKHFLEYAFPATEETRFVLAELGNDAGIYGAVQMILNA